MILHASEFEGNPDKRAFTYDELDRFFEAADERALSIRALGRKGYLAALRDSAMLKDIYAYGLRRNGARMLDEDDFHFDPELPEFGKFGALHVRYGKSVRGGQPRPYWVHTVIEIKPYLDAVKQYITEVRPHYTKRRPGAEKALFLTERGGRISRAHMNEVFTEIRDLAGLTSDLTLHCLRHAYATHLTEWGYDRAFVQKQLGHAHPSTTSIYANVSNDFKHHQIRRAIRRTLARSQRKKDEVG
jgi:site-specific recombinase XerD